MKKTLLATTGFVVALTAMVPTAYASYESEMQFTPAKQQTVDPKLMMTEESYEAPEGKLFDEIAYFAGETSYNDFVNVIVINKKAKGEGAQTLKLYSNRQLILETAVSTGREDLEIVAPLTGVFRKVFGTKGTSESHWRHTTRGFYTIKRVQNAEYRSGESKVQMPYAMFFNDKRGLAVHQVPPDLTGGEEAGNRQLGRRASSGCVRVHRDQIVNIHTAVTMAGKGQVPLINSRTGAAELDANGSVKYSNGWRTIVIVEEY
jgi:hypothetical protein